MFENEYFVVNVLFNDEGKFIISDEFKSLIVQRYDSEKETYTYYAFRLINNRLSTMSKIDSLATLINTPNISVSRINGNSKEIMARAFELRMKEIRVTEVGTHPTKYRKVNINHPHIGRVVSSRNSSKYLYRKNDSDNNRRRGLK